MRRIMVEKTHPAGKMEAAQASDSSSDTPAAATGVVEDKEPLVPVETATVPQEEYDRLKAERDLLFDRLARLQAEFDNSRKRLRTAQSFVTLRFPMPSSSFSLSSITSSSPSSRPARPISFVPASSSS
jgi:hypothetical protein